MATSIDNIISNRIKFINALLTTIEEGVKSIYDRIDYEFTKDNIPEKSFSKIEILISKEYSVFGKQILLIINELHSISEVLRTESFTIFIDEDIYKDFNNTQNRTNKILSFYKSIINSI